MRTARAGLFCSAIAVLGMLPAARAAAGPAPDARAVRFFEAEVRPLFVAKCQKCHGPRQQRGGLRLDSRTALEKGGKSGPAVVPGKAEESLLIEAVNYESLEMPPDGPLSPRETAILTEWVKQGAVWPDNEPARSAGVGKITAEDRAYWAFQAVVEPKVPEPRDEGGWARNPIDRFILSRLQADRLEPAPEADRRTLVRRASYDLTGLPPTEVETARFLADTTLTAYEAMIDRLLASPRYGERWGRFWLDLVRYAESDGHGADRYRPEAWRYRDYVIRAFNDDKPYDRFVREQLAGDELEPGDAQALTATGFLRHWIYENNQREIREVREIILNDVTDVTADVFLGLGFGCARCHDHKFDPILQDDYYRLQAFFAPMMPRDDIITSTAAERARFQAEFERWETATAATRKALAEVEEPVRRFLTDREIRLLPQDLKDIYRKPAAAQSPLERQLVALIDRLKDGSGRSLDGQFKNAEPATQSRWKSLLAELARHDPLRPEPLAAPMVVSDVGPLAPPTTLPGSGKVIEPGFPTVLGGGTPDIAPPPAAPGSTGRRSALAEWIAAPGNPLTARVMVNRIWQQHFGTGLVATASDFGRLGERPSHPELLDWLARRFVAEGWSVKAMHRRIMTSAAYRQSALVPGTPLARRKDPGARSLWRMGIRRLDADQIRDTLLAVSGELEAQPGGPSVDPAVPRRSIYAKVIRYSPEPLLQAFDAPDGFVSIPQRDTTTTATQALTLLNGAWARQRAERLATRLGQAGEPVPEPEFITRAYHTVLGRDPDPYESRAALRFLAEQPSRIEAAGQLPAGTSARDQSLVDFCHVLLNSNELIYVD